MARSPQQWLAWTSLSLWSAFGWAQTPATERLPSVVISAPREDGTAPSLDAARERISRIPGGASVIDADTVRTGRTSTLDDALKFAPGVVVAPRFGSEEARLSIRGSGVQRTFHLRGVVLLQDGVPLNQADGGGDFQAVETLASRYITVLRGANAFGLGAATLGGVVDFVSPTGRSDPGLRLRAEAGSFEYVRAQAQLGQSHGAFDGMLSVSHYQQDGYRDHAEQNTQRVFGNLGWRASDAVDTRFFIAAVHTNSALPGNVTRAELEANPRQADPNNLRNDYHRDFDLVRLANKTHVELGDRTFVELGAYYAWKSLFHPIFQVIEDDSDDIGAQLRFVHESAFAGMRNTFSTGVLGARGEIDDNRFVNVGGRSGARTGQADQTATNTSVFMENALEVRPGTTLITGVQWTNAKRRSRDQYLADGVDNSYRQQSRRWSPRLGLVQALGDEAQVYANVSGSFEPPSFGELAGGPNITPVAAQRATTFEIGTRGQSLGASVHTQWDIALYRARVRNELLALTNAAGAPLGTVNAARTIHQGIEAGGEAVWRGQWGTRAVYTFNDFAFDGDAVFGNRQLAGLPRHIGTVEAFWQPKAGLRFGPTLTAASRTWVDHANTVAAPGYAVLGIRLSQRVTPDVSWFVEARNLTDRRYAATTSVTANAAGRDGRYYLPGDGRSIFGGVQWKL
ncbi:MAG TPA: TonB-dependent receptor [Burkholderiaceae bacterium]|nr:TonB-dependent receptor [Burkholderiaceae bacterium]